MTPEVTETGGEFPSQKQLAGMGDLAFLFLRAQQYQSAPIYALRRMLEPAIDTGQFAVLRQDHVPRAMFSWAHLSTDAEAKHLSGEGLTSQDWMSGDRLWLMDVVAPYGQGSAGQMIRAWHKSIRADIDQYHTLRASRVAGHFRRYEMRRRPNDRWGSRMTGLIAAPEPKQIS